MKTKKHPGSLHQKDQPFHYIGYKIEICFINLVSGFRHVHFKVLKANGDNTSVWGEFTSISAKRDC